MSGETVGTGTGPAGRGARVRRMVIGADGLWRRAAYGGALLPVGVAGLVLSAVGMRATAGRLQRRVASGSAGLPGSCLAGRDRAAGVVAFSLLGALLGALCLFLDGLVVFTLVRNLVLYPFTDHATAYRSWGGPSLAGAWAAHAALTLAMQPLLFGVIRGLTFLQGRLAGRLLGERSGGWPLLVCLPVVAGGVAFFISWLHQL